MMIEAGHIALIAALAFSLFHMAFIWARPILTRQPHLFFSSSVLILIFLSFIILLQAYIYDDFSVAIVAQNSHSDLPIFFKITALWGNHEGSILLFTLLLSCCTWGLACFSNKSHQGLISITLSCQQAILSAFLLFILLTSNPFLHLVSPPSQGSDLNPLLQDIGLMLHPPLLYLGLVGFSIVFSYAIAALLIGRCEAELGRLIRPWLLFSWSMLTAGISFGSYWAYYELGWGGYWFWDPVENASLMPWLSACALIHSASLLAKRNICKIWTLFLSILTFSLSLLGTFLVRADILISVHNFVSIPERSYAILMIVLFFCGGAWLLFALRSSQINTTAIYQPISREGALIFNTIFLSIACATVLIGTLYPIILEAFWHEKISVGPPFFNMMLSCLMLPVFIIMPFGPHLGWKRADIVTSFERLGLALATSLAIIITILLLTDNQASLTTLRTAIFLGLAAWLTVGSFCDFLHSSGVGTISLRRALYQSCTLPFSVYGRCLAHGGVGITLGGIISVHAFSHEVITTLQIGQELTIKDKIVRFEQIIPYKANTYLEDRLEFSLIEEQDQQHIGTLTPARRFFPARNMETSEVGLFRQGLSQYYLSAGHFDEQGGLTVQIWYKSYVLLIWLGGFFMAAGGLISLLGRGKGAGRKR